MKVIALIFSLFLSLIISANEDNKLTVHMDGLTVEVLNFEEGDKLKLFELETGDHILSKSYSLIDLSQLPVGSYLLENNEGKSLVINRQEEELMIDGAVILQEEEFIVGDDAQFADVTGDEEMNVEKDFINNYVNSNQNLLNIERQGDIIVVVDFEEGDKLKLFEVKDTIHVLSKTTNEIDLSQLPVGLYILENSKGDSVVVEKFIETQATLTDL
ncbi:hypothetical protein J8L88_13005 [Aquimarina sp. MMG015]|uniref:hypothetical protein n=1 Tax=unclassified Aquimarina TaxID=2627091 RepID=UPI000E4A9A5F|nr:MULTISPECIES: hypothetical protein [unclassified Aquimarina]AXT56130.1 hypothetical protein D1815_10335 [Aquimarina sp. AD1]MBQ4803774.1 hypothetical protein [Aquimarina sp. MMG015]RKN21962.1 hypothetical protein D7035_12275 [Aquimarina sp. AD1]